MLRYRMVFGPLMIAVTLAVFYVDEQLDHLHFVGDLWEQVRGQRNYLPSGLAMFAMFITAIVLVTHELAEIFRAKGIRADWIMLCTAGVTGCTVLYVIPADTSSGMTLAIVCTLAVMLFLGALIRHSWRQRTDGAVAAASSTMFAMIYMGLLPGFLMAVRRWHGAWVIFAIILITKFCDIGAYFVGRAIGKRKLIPWLSPGKTWEGLTGGVIVSAAVAVGLVTLSNHWHYGWRHLPGGRAVGSAIPLWFAALAGALMGVTGQFGDLVASLFKRDADIKDSGNAIPGFGGLIDVVDSIAVVAPLAYWLLVIAARL